MQGSEIARASERGITATGRGRKVDDRRRRLFNVRIVPDVIQPSPTGRAKCRGCGSAIAAAELRFGESLPNPYGEGETFSYYHLRCAACFRPEKCLECWSSNPVATEEADWLERAARFGVEHPRVVRLLRAERAASARARCRQCHEVQEKGSWRLALHLLEEGRFTPIGTLHVSCALAYFGTTDLLERIERLSPGLEPGASHELAELLAKSADGPGVVRAREPETLDALASSSGSRRGG